MIADYLEAIPLRKATPKNISRELILPFFRVKLPRDLLNDQGTPFNAMLMLNMCWLLQVKQFQTSMYHPQMDRLDGWFNQALKKMLWRVVEEDG